MKKIIIFICGLFCLPTIVLAGFTANGNINVNQVVFGSAFADMIIFSGSASNSWSFNSGVFSVTNPGVFKVGSADTAVKSIIVKNGSTAVACAQNSTPGTSYVTLPTTAATYNIEPSATIDCCSAVANAATYNSFPACGAATCISGYNLSGGQCIANSGSRRDRTAPIISAIAISTKINSATISWVTNEISDSAVEFGLTANYGNLITSSNMTLSHSLDLPNLLADTIYRYHLKSSDPSNNVALSTDYFFRTLPQVSTSTLPMPQNNATSTPPITPNNQATSTENNANNQIASSTGRISLLGVSSSEVNRITAEEVKNLLAQKRFFNLIEIEKNIYTKIIALTTKPLTQDDEYIIIDFIHFGTPTTKSVGAGERGGSIASFNSAFGRLPSSQLDWQDVIKIANGRWPTQTSALVEAKAKNIVFPKIYGRAANLKNQNDNAAVTVIAYGLRPAQRDANSEKSAIKSFKFIYGKNPVSAQDWDIVRAIAYSGAKR
jgi:hypothetical protein